MDASTTRPRVLLAEDEPLVSDLLQEVLEDAGYEVVAALSGQAALAELDAGETFDGVVTDINMGKGPSGWDVATHARELRPNIAIVFMSGDSVHEWSSRGVPQSIVVTKPFAPSQVAVAIATLLNKGDADPLA